MNKEILEKNKSSINNFTDKMREMISDAIVEEDVLEIGAWLDQHVERLFVFWVGIVCRYAEIGLPDGLYLSAYFLWKPNVVLVAKGDKIAFSLERCSVEIPVEAQTLFVKKQADVIVSGRIVLEQLACAIGRPIVLYDDFMERIVAGQHRIELFAQEGHTVVGAHHHRYPLMPYVVCRSHYRSVFSPHFLQSLPPTRQ